MPAIGDQRSIGDQNYVVVPPNDEGIKSLIEQMNASISKVENPRFLQSVLGKYEVLDGEPNVPMALVTPGCEGCSNGKKPKPCYAGLRDGGFLRCLPCGRRMCSFEPRNKSSSGAWMVASNDIPLVADFVSGTASIVRHLIKDLPASHPLVTAARKHLEQGKIILDRVNEGRIGPKHKPTLLPDTSSMRPHEAIASDVAAIDELSERVHRRANTDGDDNDDGPGPNGAFPPMDNYAPPPFNIQPPNEEEEAGVEAALPTSPSGVRQRRAALSEDTDEDEGEDRKRRKPAPSSTRGRGAAPGKRGGRGRGRGKAAA